MSDLVERLRRYNAPTFHQAAAYWKSLLNGLICLASMVGVFLALDFVNFVWGAQ